MEVNIFARSQGIFLSIDVTPMKIFSPVMILRGREARKMEKC